jgi:multicomponent K+:H+ antiporter subunit D
MLLTLAQAGSKVFWHVDEPAPARVTGAARSVPMQWMPAALLLGCIVAWTLLAGPATAYARAAAQQLLAPVGYIEAVLGPSDAVQQSRDKAVAPARQGDGS